MRRLECVLALQRLLMLPVYQLEREGVKMGHEKRPLQELEGRRKPLPAEAGRFSLRLKAICFEPQNKEPQNIEVKGIFLFLQKRPLFEIPCSIFKMQNRVELLASKAKVLNLANGKIMNPRPENGAFKTQQNQGGFNKANLAREDISALLSSPISK